MVPMSRGDAGKAGALRPVTGSTYYGVTVDVLASKEVVTSPAHLSHAVRKPCRRYKLSTMEWICLVLARFATGTACSPKIEKRKESKKGRMKEEGLGGWSVVLVWE